MSISIVSILKNEKMIPLIIDNYNRIEYENKNLIIVDDNKNNNIDRFLNVDKCIYIHFNDKDKISYFEKIDSSNKENLDIGYSKITNRLPIGFLRDYVCGMSDSDYIFHMNDDCIYNSQVLQKKLD